MRRRSRPSPVGALAAFDTARDTSSTSYSPSFFSAISGISSRVTGGAPTLAPTVQIPPTTVVKAAAPPPAPVPIAPASWPEVKQVATAAASTIPTPPPEAQIKPTSTPASDALGVTQALQTGLPPVDAAVKALPEAFVQAAGGPVAQTPLGSLLGVGLGGATTGTGPLPGALGVAAQQLFSSQGVPTPQRFPTVRVILELHPSFRRALEGAGTGCATRLWNIKPRVLGDFRQAFLDLAMMRREDEFRAAMLTLLRELVNHVSMGLGAPLPPLGTGLIQAPSPSLAYQTSPLYNGIRDLAPPIPVAATLPPAGQAIVNAIRNAAFAPTAAPLLTGSLSGPPMAATPIAPMPVKAANLAQAATIVGSLQGPPIAAVPVRAAGAGPAQTVVPIGASSIKPMTVVPVGAASPVSGLGSRRTARWRA